ncbi:hypothetical protein [Solicola sp. PLA-1-18]|uniref:hypothetical protein n=1 Tax=Solicola sp. PLA-1-18 TaxID=3380532 RepID=UPI003B7D7FEB
MSDAARRALADDLRDVWAPRAGTGPVTVLDVGDGSDGLLLAGDGHQVTVLARSPDDVRGRVDQARLGHRCTVVTELAPSVAWIDVAVAHDTPLTHDAVADLASRVRPGGFVSLAGRDRPTADDAERWLADAGLRVVVRRDDRLWHVLAVTGR